MAKSKRGKHEVNAGSMADIAFLLLIFFLVVTTMDVDKGITVKLPPWPEDEEQIIDVKEKQRNIFAVLINSRDELLVEGDPMQINQIKRYAKEFVENPFNRTDLSESPDKAIVSFKNDRGTSYEMYVKVYNELRAAYNELRDEKAQELYGVDFNELKRAQQMEVRDIYPIKISEAEPTDVGE